MKHTKLSITLAILAAVLPFVVQAAPPPIIHDIESNGQQAQELADLELQQGGSAVYQARLTSMGRYLSLAGLTARWEGRSSATSTQALQVTSSTTYTSGVPNYFEFEIDSTETGSSVTNWVWSLIAVESGSDYVIGTGRLDVPESAWTGAASVITNTTTQVAIDASIAIHAAIKEAHLTIGTDVLAPDGDGSGLSGVVTAEVDPVWVAALAAGFTSAGPIVATEVSTAAGADLSTALQAETDTMQDVVTRGGTVTSGVVTIDAANARTNTVGGHTTILGLRVQSGTGVATGLYAHAEGDSTTASGANSHAEGVDTEASGYGSHAEGLSTEASGNYSHAEGVDTEAIGVGSHAEGESTTASGDSSHAEGFSTEASGDYSHAAGRNASATNDNTYVWSDGTTTSSTTTKQFTVHADNGIRLLGAPTEGVDPTAAQHFVTKTYGESNFNDAAQLTGNAPLAVLTNALANPGATLALATDGSAVTAGGNLTVAATNSAAYLVGDGANVSNVDALTLGGESAIAFEDADAAIAKTDEAETLTAAWDIGTATNLQIAGIDATGTPSGTTYLRGDGAWETPAGGGASFDLYGLKSVMIDWHQGEYQEGPTTNSAGVMTPWDYINITNSWATYSWYSADTNLQSTYNVGFVYIPTWAASWGTTAMQYRVVSTSTNAADNYSTLNIMDGSSSYSVSNLVSATAENWTAWTDIALASLPASMTNLTTLGRVILRQHFYAKSSNEIGRVELKCNFAQ